MDRTKIAVEPASRPEMQHVLSQAVREAGGDVVPVDEACALIWADPKAASAFPAMVASAPDLQWVQLPYAGIENFADNLDPSLTWTCGKGVYADPVAEHILTLTLAGFRNLHESIPAASWPVQEGRNLLGANVTVFGAGGITDSLSRLLAPWDTTLTVVRRREEPYPGADRTLPLSRAHEAVADADVVVLALALTDETRGIVNSAFLDAMRNDAWIINVARGAHIVTDDLVAALQAGVIGGAGIDVTDPEPLPDGHPLWQIPNCIVTPHVGNTPQMGLPLLANRVRTNVGRWLAGEDLVGLVDVETGY